MPRLKWTRHADLAISRGCSVRREEYLDHMTFAANARPLFTEIFGPLIGLKEEWEEQGASPEELDFSAFRYRCPLTAGLPINTGWLGGPAPETLSETDDFLTYRDAMGRTMKLAKGVSTLALPMDWPVRGMDDWLAIRHHYAFDEARFGAGWEQMARDHLAAGRAVTVSLPGGYDTSRQLMGDEAACLAFADQPELIADILQTVGAMVQRVLDRVSAAVQVDILSVHEDMAGRSGPMVGPRQVREFIAPYYRRVWDMLAERGARLFDQDSDGNMNPVIDAFLDAGVNVMHPMEPAAGMDIVQVRQRYGRRLAFYGGIDKHVLRRSHEEIDAELAYRVPPLLASGGCVFALDHRIPNGTPLGNYRYYVQRMWEMLGD
ncbi:MAG: hypothetical protein HZB16_16705 [Armatimonadetes bacterium]|nr:hypothetical protein [Armatimonadota bacterium]